jgi:hypothetical protein
VALAICCFGECLVQGACGSLKPKNGNEHFEFSQELLEAKYANYFEIGHNAFEFLLDFGQKYTGNDECRMHARIVTGPSYAKELMRVLAKSIEQYEQAFGEIRDDL